MSFALPICPTCEAYVVKKKQAEDITKWVTIGLAVLAGVVTTLLKPDLLKMDFFPTVGVIAVGTYLALLVILLFGVEKRIHGALAGPPPEGYSHSGSECCTMVGPEHLSFYNQEYHKQFAQLNPDKVKWS